MYTKILIRTFPSDEECELFESLLKTRWPTLLEGIKNVSFDAFNNMSHKDIRTVVWFFPDKDTQNIVEKLIDEHISKFTKTLAPKTMTFSGENIFSLST